MRPVAPQAVRVQHGIHGVAGVPQRRDAAHPPVDPDRGLDRHALRCRGDGHDRVGTALDAPVRDAPATHEVRDERSGAVHTAHTRAGAQGGLDPDSEIRALLLRQLGVGHHAPSLTSVIATSIAMTCSSV
ncbi:hypothetical protein AB1285_21015 [Microbacterium sp. NRRL B-14842]|uniref:hypothetical protein n=1 Tax=Microbacterium sp. NRRL B-14842 TaxID=3162881 RepID=UPI003D2DCB55